MRNPGIYSDYPSLMCSKYYTWCKELGYDELDVLTYDDGEWSLIQYHNRPIVPSLTRWSFVLQGLRRVEVSPWIIKKYADQLNLEKHTIWEEQAKSERRAIEEVEAEERRADMWAAQMAKGVRNNPDLMERIAKNGLKEVNPLRILNNIPRARLGKGYKERA